MLRFSTSCYDCHQLAPDVGVSQQVSTIVRELSLAAGAEFLVVICGDIMRMPGLPRQPAANQIFVNDHGQIEATITTTAAAAAAAAAATTTTATTTTTTTNTTATTNTSTLPFPFHPSLFFYLSTLSFSRFYIFSPPFI